MDKSRQMEDTESRNTRKLTGVSLATQYRLCVAPKRPEQRKITRKKKLLDELKDIKRERRGAARKLSDGVTPAWMKNNEEEEFDFDAEDDGFCDAPPVDKTLTYMIYKEACSRLDVRPVRCIYDAFREYKETLTCKELVLRKNDVKACTISLVGDTTLDTLQFDYNCMGCEGGVYFGDVLKFNTYLADVRIAYNDLGTPVAKSICNALSKNMKVKRLDLRGNKFDDEAAKYFRDLLVENSAIRELFLGQNNFKETGGELLAEGLANNDFLVVLDLSWNHIRLNGAVAIGKALEKNLGLEVLNLADNGFHIQGTQALAKALEVNRSLVDLDISSNRIPQACIGQLLKRLKNNATLLNLRIGRNNFSSKGAPTLLEYIKNCPDMVLNYVDFADLHVTQEFVSLLNEINETRFLKVNYGGVWSHDRDPLGQQDPSEDELALLEENPLYVLMEMMKALEFRLVDLFHIFDKDQNKSLSIDELQEGLETVNIPLKKKSLEILLKSVDTDKNGEVDFVELSDANRQYKEKLKDYVKDGIPIETTEIGRISKLVRKIIKENELYHVTKYQRN